MQKVIDILVQWWPVLTTLVLPFVVSLIAKCSWSGAAKGWLAFGLSALVGVGAAFTAGVGFSPETLSLVILAAFGGVTLAYRMFSAFGITNAWLDALLNLGSA